MDFTETAVWQLSMDLAERVVSTSRWLPAEERFGMRSQLTRCATSVPSNIAEGWVRESWKDKVRFLGIAHGSLAELKTQLILCTRIGWLDPTLVAEQLAVADQIARMLTVLKTRWRNRANPDPTGGRSAPRPHPIK